MHAHQHRRWIHPFVHVALHQRHVRVGRGVAFIGDDAERAVLRGHVRFGHAAHGKLAVPDVVADDVTDGRNVQTVFFRKGFQIVHAGHGTVFLENLAQHRRRTHSGEAGKIGARFGDAHAGEHAPLPRAQRKHVPGRDDVVRTGVFRHGRADGGGAVRRGNARGHALARLDGHRERRLTSRAVRRHERQIQPVGHVRRKCQTHQSAGVTRHEVHGFGVHLFGGHDQMSAAFAIVVIHHDDHPAVADVVDSLFNGAKRR